MVWHLPHSAYQFGGGRRKGEKGKENKIKEMRKRKEMRKKKEERKENEEKQKGGGRSVRGGGKKKKRAPISAVPTVRSR